VWFSSKVDSAELDGPVREEAERAATAACVMREEVETSMEAAPEWRAGTRFLTAAAIDSL
jgi:hypothetical protein